MFSAYVLSISLVPDSHASLALRQTFNNVDVDTVCPLYVVFNFHTLFSMKIGHSIFLHPTHITFKGTASTHIFPFPFTTEFGEISRNE